ncbi:uncharacterized protein LOC143942100 isoform X2 [Lithobates pipiens]
MSNFYFWIVVLLNLKNLGGKKAQSNVEFPLVALQLQQMLEKKKAQSNVEFPWWPCSFSKCGRKKKPKAIRNFLLALPLQQMLARCPPRLNYGNTMLSESKLRVGRP